MQLLRCGPAPIWKPSDVQLLEAYDGFSFITLSWIEALGFLKVGRAGRSSTAALGLRDGEPCPIRTAGSFPAGRLHGYMDSPRSGDSDVGEE